MWDWAVMRHLGTPLELLIDGPFVEITEEQGKPASPRLFKPLPPPPGGLCIQGQPLGVIEGRITISVNRAQKLYLQKRSWIPKGNGLGSTLNDCGWRFVSWVVFKDSSCMCIRVSKNSSNRYLICLIFWVNLIPCTLTGQKIIDFAHLMEWRRAAKWPGPSSYYYY